MYIRDGEMRFMTSCISTWAQYEVRLCHHW